MRFGQTATHLCVRLDDVAVSLDVLRQNHALKPVQLTESITRADNLNPFLGLPVETHKALRARLLQLLSRSDHLNIGGCTKSLAPYPLDDDDVLCPLKPTDFVDFYCSRHHAFRVGCLFRGPENALPEQYFDLPIGYHGRSSTIFVSGTDITRPSGIQRGPKFGPSERLDYELEVGFVLRGHRGHLTPEQAWDKIFGVVLLNDWSARDIQAFEYKPLGPFLGKSFATSVGAWVTPMSSLQDWQTSNQDSQHSVLPHLTESADHHLDIPLSAHLDIPNEEGLPICESNLKNLAWSAAQMVAHMSSNGTIISTGDVIATGTISGPEKGAEGCLLELTQGGKEPLTITSTTQRTFLEDGDTVILLGGHEGVGLAPCRGKIVKTDQ